MANERRALDVLLKAYFDENEREHKQFRERHLASEELLSVHNTRFESLENKWLMQIHRLADIQQRSMKIIVTTTILSLIVILIAMSIK